MKTTTALLTNKACGYPTRGSRRRRKPTILACLHQTANAKATAMQARNYANRAGSWGPSATAYIDRDGTIVRAIDPAKYAAWSQGDVASPDRKIPTIAAAFASGVNISEWVQSIECSGAGTGPYTDAKFEAVARLVAAASRALGIAINRSTAARSPGRGRGASSPRRWAADMSASPGSTPWNDGDSEVFCVWASVSRRQAAGSSRHPVGSGSPLAPGPRSHRGIKLGP